MPLSKLGKWQRTLADPAESGAICVCITCLALSGFATGEGMYQFGFGGKPVICVPKAEVFSFNRQLTHSNLFLDREYYHSDLVIVHYGAGELLSVIPGFLLDHSYRNDDPPNTLTASVFVANQLEKKAG